MSDNLKEFLKSLLSDFDPAAFIPELNSLLGWLELIVRIAVMVGPLVLLGLGLWYFLAPPKEANYSAGYRCFFGMGSVEAWRFTQRLAGSVWSVLGLILTIVMALICNGYRGMEAMEIVTSGFKCIAWEAVLALVSCLVINITVMILFDAKGNRRGKKNQNPPAQPKTPDAGPDEGAYEEDFPDNG